MTYDFSLQDIMGNFTGGSLDPNAMPDYGSTATTAVAKIAPTPIAQVAETQPTPATAPTRVNGIPSKYRTGAVVADQAAYNADIQQQESGNRPDIGYHDRSKSSAFGPFGTTAAGWQDARKLNPNLPEDITKATQEQLTAGQDAYTQQNAKYLTNYGVPVNEGTLRTAHLLGAKGLSDYLATGYLSPQAIAANGGEAKLRNIVEARLGGQTAPASGATQAVAPQTQTAVNTETGETYQQLVPTSVSPAQSAQQQATATEQPYTGGGLRIGGQTQQDFERRRQVNTVLNSDSMENISKIAFDPNSDRDQAAAALEKLHDAARVQIYTERAQKKFEELRANPTPQNINKILNDKREDGSVMTALRAMFFGLMGAKDKEKEEWDKFSPKKQFQSVTLDNGETVTAISNPNTGEILGARKGNEYITDPKVLDELQSQVSTGKKWQTNAELMQGSDGKIYQTQHNEKGAVRTVDTTSGKALPKGVTLERLRDKSKLEQMAVGQDYRRENDLLRFANSIRTLDYKSQLDAVAKKRESEINAGNRDLSDTELADLGITRPALMQYITTGQVVPPQATGVGAGGTGGGAGGTGVRMSVDERKRLSEERKQASDIETSMIKERDKANQEYSTELAKSYRTAPAQLATINRVQKAIDKNPEFFGIVSNSPGMQAFINAQSDEKKSEALTKLYTELNIPQSKRAEFDSVVNDYRNLAVSAVTNSGLTASQTNTERESQRVMGTVGSMTDKPAAAKAALEYAKAKVEYQAAKAKAWATERKTNKGIDQLDFEVNFDATQGEKIFEDANKRMEKIIGGKAVVSQTPQSNTRKRANEIIGR